MKVNLPAVLDALAWRSPQGHPRTYANIGRDLHITGERVRQIARDYMGERGKVHRVPAITEANARARRMANPRLLKPNTFVKLVRRWLYVGGWGWCTHCHQATPLLLMCSHVSVQLPHWCKKCWNSHLYARKALRNGRVDPSILQVPQNVPSGL